MSPHLPITPDEITDAAVGAAEAGAAIVHLHARDPQTGRPDQTAAIDIPVKEFRVMDRLSTLWTNSRCNHAGKDQAQKP